jgi:hypothetical protein
VYNGIPERQDAPCDLKLRKLLLCGHEPENDKATCKPWIANASLQSDEMAEIISKVLRHKMPP